MIDKKKTDKLLPLEKSGSGLVKQNVISPERTPGFAKAASDDRALDTASMMFEVKKDN